MTGGMFLARFCVIVYVLYVLTVVVFVLTAGNDQMPCKMFGGGEYTVNMMIPKVGFPLLDCCGLREKC